MIIEYFGYVHDRLEYFSYVHDHLEYVHDSIDKPKR